MKTYTPDQLVILDSGQIDQVQKSIDGDALAFLDDKKEELDFLNPEEQAHLKEYYTDTMEKYRLLSKPSSPALPRRTVPGSPNTFTTST